MHAVIDFKQPAPLVLVPGRVPATLSMICSVHSSGQSPSRSDISGTIAVVSSWLASKVA